MYTYIAKCGHARQHGGYARCLAWAEAQVDRDPDSVVKIYHARRGERWMRVVAEVTNEVRRIIRAGRQVRVREGDRRG